MSRPPKENPILVALDKEIEKAEVVHVDALAAVAAALAFMTTLRDVRCKITTPVVAPNGPPKAPRAARNSIPADVLSALDKHALAPGGPMALAQIEIATGQNRSSIRKALAALLKQGKVIENAAGEWGLRAAEPAKAAE